MDPSHAQLELTASYLAISEPRPCPVDDQASSAGDQAPTAGDQASSADDQTDGRSISTGFFSSTKDRLPTAKTHTEQDSSEYYMRHDRRGDCIIFVYESYGSLGYSQRDCADEDARLCREAFGQVGFEVQVHKNKTRKEFESILEKASNADHSKCDALAVVFMSHGDFKNGKQILILYDQEVPAESLWKPFLGNTCTTLAGKPKMFFIQACRGNKVDKGVGMKVATDGPGFLSKPSYVIPAHADLLIMWASFEGMYAFKSCRNGINGSVFIHFLAKKIMEEGSAISLNDLLLDVTRLVAIDYESACTDSKLNQCKQVPHTSSTLMRKLFFPAPSH